MQVDNQKTKAPHRALPPLRRHDLGERIPKRGGKLTAKLAAWFLAKSGWQTVGQIPDIEQCVLLAVPHTSNVDGVYAIPAWLALDLDVHVMGKRSLFAVPVLAQFLRWAGVIPIDRAAKGSVRKAAVARFKAGERLFLALAPEGTRSYTQQWKTGFYYIALEAGVPIVPVAMDYASKQIRFMTPVTATGDIESDMAQIIEQYRGVVPRHPNKLSQPLQDLQ